MRHAIDMSEAPISTIHGLMKFEIKNWGTAKDTPDVGGLGTDSRDPFLRRLGDELRCPLSDWM
jgi:hypothetical protein